MLAPSFFSKALMAPLRAVGLLCAALALMAPGLSDAQDAATLEKRVKAAYILKFADYLDWPTATFARADSPLVFGVLGDEQIAAELTQDVAGRTVSGHPLVVRRLKDAKDFDAGAGINILFVAGKDSARVTQVARLAGTQPLLIISETDGALDHGSAINFVLDGDRVKFEIAVDNAEKRGLKLSSRLLTVARNVYPAPGTQ